SVFVGSHKHDRLPIPYGKGKTMSGVSGGLFTRFYWPSILQLLAQWLWFGLSINSTLEVVYGPSFGL
ncbi:hypothetical protein, partial [Pseudomonas duriflava]|uniref:hypothetical protein n=1 Tax=Pseudomonas duriflava TaxID=459528 RepID=UPI001ABFC0AE